MHIDKRKAKTLLRQAVKEKGRDHEIEECRYFAPTESGLEGDCIVGTAVLPLIEDKDEAYAVFRVSDDGLVRTPNGTGILSEDVTKAFKVVGITFTKGAIDVLEKAQRIQDAHEAWGYALDQALEV